MLTRRDPSLGGVGHVTVTVEEEGDEEEEEEETLLRDEAKWEVE